MKGARSSDLSIEGSDRSKIKFELVGREGVEPPQLSRRFYNRWATLNLDLTENG